MTAQLATPERLLTWLDVERHLKQNTVLWTQLPPGVLAIDCFADGMEIRHEQVAAVDEWLGNLFGHAYSRDKKSIALRIGNASYPIEFVEEKSGPVISIGQTYPLWRDVTYLPDPEVDQAVIDAPLIPFIADASYPNALPKGPDLVSFHSFKGGVGRTTALMTYVAACMLEPKDGPKKVLVIDADLEAPGVSFWLDEANMPMVSFVQLMEALHYPPTSVSDTLDYFAEELRKTSINVSGMERELFILPSALKLSEIQDMPVTPEHLARNPSNPWQLTDYLHALGSRLGVDAVFIDLRAGLSELASPILFDPRIDHFFVTTVAPQSVRGMKEVLRSLYAFNNKLPLASKDLARPTVILSLLTKELRESSYFEQALRILGEAYPASDALTSGVEWLEAEFLSTLMSIGSVREALEALPQSTRLFASASEWANGLYATPIVPALAVVDGAKNSMPDRQSLALALKQVCEKAQFAESDADAPILATEPLLNLGKHFARELPNLLIIGAKGAGKTFTYRQLVRSATWQSFLGRLGFDERHISPSAIFPVLWSSNIADKPSSEGGEVKVAQEGFLENLDIEKALLLRGTEVARQVKDALNSPPLSWEDFWDDLIARQLGVNSGGLAAVNQILADRKQRAVFVFDGIEDHFEDATIPNAAEAIQALLRLTNRISELSNRHFGAVIFVRADYVQVTSRQNLGQFIQRYQPFRLQWNPESFLRLAYMLSCEAQIQSSDPKQAESLRMEQLKDNLEALWGKKLGGEKSKEAHSARWVYAALCDLKGNVQARDLVRFLKFAADLEAGRTADTWPDRILSPESMRKAIPLCSDEKIAEAKQEIAPLKRWAALLEEHHVRNLKIPFSQSDGKLDAGLLGALQDIGVIYEDLDGNLGDERLFLPEIYRHGLRFETSAVGRPRTQALLKKNIGSIPL